MGLSQATVKEYLTNTTDLKAVADAIRAKGGTAAQLVYPTGFVSAIQAIETGITPQLIVTTSAGAAVTATKGSKTVSGTAGTDGTCTLELSEAGEWSVTASLNGNSKTESIMIGTQTLDASILSDTFAENSWAQIAEACQTGTVPSTWIVGNSKTMTIGGTDYQIDIIGKNHDTYADGSGTAPLTFQMHDCYATTYAMNAANTNVGGWKGCAMRKTHLPAILALMPAEVQTDIREVNKLTSAGNTSATIETTADKLFLLSEVEVFGTDRFSYDAREHGTIIIRPETQPPKIGTAPTRSGGRGLRTNPTERISARLPTSLQNRTRVGPTTLMAWPSASASEEGEHAHKKSTAKQEKVNTEGRMKPVTTEERVTEVEQRAKSNSHRIDEMQTDLKNLTELTASVKVLATKQENVESDVREIKTDVKALTEKPGKRWDAIVAAVVAGLVGWALAHAGLG